MWGDGGEFFSFSVKEKTWPTPLTPLVNTWTTPIWRYIRGDPLPPFLPSIYTFCALDKISILCGPVSYTLWPLLDRIKRSAVEHLNILRNQGLFAMDAFAVIENTIERVLDNDDI